MSNDYGYCPICGSRSVTRERRIDGDDTCAQGHRYKSSQAVIRKSNINAICEHGHLARKCEVCLRDGDIAERDARIRELEEAVKVLAEAANVLDGIRDGDELYFGSDYTPKRMRAVRRNHIARAAIEAAKEQP